MAEPDYKKLFVALYDAVDEAQKIDNTGGDAAVSVTLWGWSEPYLLAKDDPEYLAYLTFGRENG